jgi:hypothetical protein
LPYPADQSAREFEPSALSGLLIGDAIKKFVIGDAEVQAAGRGVIEYDFETVEFRRAYNRSLWPTNLDDRTLASKFVRGGGDLDARVPQEVVAFAGLIVVRFAKIIGLLQTGKIVAIDMNNSLIHYTVWLGPDLAIDIRKSHLYEIPSVSRWRQGYNDSENRLLRERLRLSLPNEAAAKSAREKMWQVRRGETLTKGETAVLDAMNSLWPHGQVDHTAKARNERINKWLEAESQSRVSTRVVQRCLKKIGFR